MPRSLDCAICADIQAKPCANILAGELLAKAVDELEDFGYYGDDEYMVHLKKCPQCGVYYRLGSADSFETGGGVAEGIERIDTQEATRILEKIIAELQAKNYRIIFAGIDKLKKELEILKTK